ncbi:hypothetical protein evm_001503 [Chilo suppressalis]|nr:hypothetical protein evm_001503 [Chilo suppressalis]
MLPRVIAILALMLLLIFEVERISTYKTSKQLSQNLKNLEKDKYSTSDTLVGKAMDFIYSNRTIMSLIARELWNVGSTAIDKIVDAKGKGAKRQ